MKILLLLAGLAIVFLGCVHSRVLTNETPPDTLAQINQDFESRSGAIKLTSGHYLRSRSFTFGADSLAYETPTHKLNAFPNMDIERVIFKDRWIGLKEGMQNGAIAGAIAGTVAGLLWYVGQGIADESRTYDSPDSSGYDVWGHNAYRHRPVYECVGISMLSGIGFGGALGAFFGGTGGSIMEVRYRFPVSKPPK